ncbi:unnamed protein product [Lactuca saligna]|uniref:Uncharacterized protein n=1 Tax=Lactuca saligna TaxID=75948 RepID=A0AA35Y7P4_LACSI|nr:unnamed protein product [Lactuca saligna]
MKSSPFSLAFDGSDLLFSNLILLFFHSREKLQESSSPSVPHHRLSNCKIHTPSSSFAFNHSEPSFTNVNSAVVFEEHPRYLPDHIIIQQISPSLSVSLDHETKTTTTAIYLHKSLIFDTLFWGFFISWKRNTPPLPFGSLQVFEF